MRSLHFVACAFCLGVLLPCHAWPANWVMQAESSLRAEYNDNLRLTTTQNDPVLARHLDMDMQLTGATPISEFVLNPKYSVSQYSSKAVRDDDVATMDATTRLHGERSDSELALAWRRDTTLTSELEDTGLIQATKYRTVRGVHPSFHYGLSERMDAQLRWDYTTVSYQNALQTPLTDYRHQAISGTLMAKTGERDSIQLDVYGTRLEAAEIANQVIDAGFQASLTHAFYDRSYGTFTFGTHRVETKQVLPSQDFNSVYRGYSGSVSLTQKRDITLWNMQALRSIDPSGYGQLIQNDKFLLSFYQGISPYWRYGVDGVYLRNMAMERQLSFDARRYARISASLYWTPYRTMQLSFHYSNQWQKYASASHGAESNEVGLSVTCQLDKKTLFP